MPPIMSNWLLHRATGAMTLLFPLDLILNNTSLLDGTMRRRFSTSKPSNKPQNARAESIAPECAVHTDNVIAACAAEEENAAESAQGRVAVASENDPNDLRSRSLPDAVLSCSVSSDGTSAGEQYICRSPSPTLEVPQPAALIDSLPVELMGLIFTFYMGDYNTDRHLVPRGRTLSFREDTTSSPIVIAAVSRRWFLITSSISALWSTINIEWPLLTDIPLISAWFRNAGTRPLTIRLHLPPNPEAPEASHYAMQVVLAEAHRWFDVDFLLPRTLHGMFSESCPRPTRLQHLRINLKSWDWSQNEARSLCTFLYSAPSLKTVKWGDGIMCKMPAVYPTTPDAWVQLESLDMVEADAPHLFRALSASPRLLHLAVDVFKDSGGGNDCITLPKLEELRFTSIERMESFNRLELPSLKSLNLSRECFRNRGAGSWRNIAPFAGLLNRSDCEITTFKLLWSDKNSRTDEKFVLEVLLNFKRFQAMEVLDLQSPVTKKTLRRLMDPRFMPVLRVIAFEELEYVAGFGKSETLTLFDDMVRSRALLDKSRKPMSAKPPSLHSEFVV